MDKIRQAIDMLDITPSCNWRRSQIFLQKISVVLFFDEERKIGPPVTTAVTQRRRREQYSSCEISYADADRLKDFPLETGVCSLMLPAAGGKSVPAIRANNSS